ncbi:UNVERIFIED_CONTAM: hypothetical protein GTU68_033452 [Idotea baltica]|nr:hypothetical protein [Idotea baltica]
MSITVASHNGLFAELAAKARAYGQLAKVRLNLTVVFSSVFGYLLAAGSAFEWGLMFLLGLGGFLVTASANSINQLLEFEYDRLMKRTKIRPLCTNELSKAEAILFAGITGIAGLSIIAFYFNSLAACAAAISLFSYAFVYTPLKRFSPAAVFVGAIPGALPPVIGWLAFTNQMGFEAYVLFAIQFLWQFPHFWAIGWIGYDDYKKAGFKLLPTSYDGRNRSTATQIIIYIIALIPASIVPFYLGMVGYWALAAALLLGVFFLYKGAILFKNCDRQSAFNLMIASIIYLPLLQIIMLIDKL